MAAYDEAKVTRFREIVARNSERDMRHAQVSAARRGDVDRLLPGLFPKNFTKQITANVLDTAAQDLGEMLGELPDITCPPLRSTSQASKTAALKRTKIVADFAETSRLQTQMYSGCDRFVTFGALPVVVEADLALMKPTFRIDSPVGAYYELDLFGRVGCYYKRWYDTVGSLSKKFPMLEAQIRYSSGARGRRRFFGLFGRSDAEAAGDNDMLEVVKYYGPDSTCVLLPDRESLVVAETANPVGRCPVFLAELPHWDEQIRGRFDQMLWIQLARARMSMFTLEAAHKAINAPLDVPSSVGQVPFGPNAVVRNDSQRPIARVPLDIPREIFAENANLQAEERIAARYPEGRSGNIDASIITGQGVQELMGGMTGQIRVLQECIAYTLREATSYALELDQTLYPDVKRPIEGKTQGAEFAEDYVAGKDIDGNFKVNVSYGMAYGMDRQRALIASLQLNGARMVDRGSVIEQFSKMFGLNAEEIERRLDIEQTNDAMMQALFNMGSLISPQASQMGVDPQQILRQLLTFQKEREKGAPVGQAFEKALQPTKEELAARQAAQEQLAATNPVAAAEQELNAPGPAGAVPVTPRGEATGDLRTLMASLTSGGGGDLRAGLSRMLPT